MLWNGKKGRAHRAAIASARPLELIDEERKRVLLELGACEYSRRALDAQEQQLAARAQALDHERSLAQEKAEGDAREAARSAGTLCSCGEPQHATSVLYEGSKQWTCKPEARK